MFSTIRKAILATALLLAAMPALSQDTVPDHFPYKVITVPGEEALAEWERLSQSGNATPIIVGGDEDLQRLASNFDPQYILTARPYEALIYAAGLTHPQSLHAMRDFEWKKIAQSFADNGNEAFVEEMEEAEGLPLGEWPIHPENNPGLLSLTDYSTGAVFEQVHIVILPTDDATEAPAYLRFGGWNANPAAGYHVAALRDWQARYGAVPVLISGDVMELCITRRPDTREDAIALAREQALMTEDIVTQGVGTLSDLGGSLYVSDWWYFWWD